MPTFVLGVFSYNFFALFLHNCMSFMIQPPEKDSGVYIHSMNQTILILFTPIPSTLPN